MQFTYSIIIPHYNLPDLLVRCLKSIPVREDLQVLVVDDLSSDENREKLKSFQDLFPNVQFVFCEKNGGGGAARNRGLDEAKGDYVLFADADDFFCEGFGSLLDEYAKQGTDIVYFNANFINDTTGEPAKQTNHVAEIINKYKKNKKKGATLLRFYFGEPWCKMVRRAVIQKHDIRFEETKIHNDTQYSYLVGFYAQSLSVCDQPIYNYVVREGSVSRTISDDRVITRVNVFARKNQFLRDNHINFFDKMMLWPFKNCKEEHRDDLYRKCVEEIEKYGFSENLVKKLLFQHRIKKKLSRLKKKLSSIFGWLGK